MEERENMSPFEQMMLEKMDELVRVHKEDYVELKQCFESISERLDAMGAPHVNDI